MENDYFSDEKELSNIETDFKEKDFKPKYEKWINSNSFLTKNISSITNTKSNFSNISDNIFKGNEKIHNIINKEYKEDNFKNMKDKKSPQQATATDSNNINYTFIWSGEGNDVKLTGSFSDWKTKYQMEKELNKNIFKFELPLEPKVYQYKFIIDGTWKCSEKCPTIDDGNGNINNVLDFTECSSKSKDKENEKCEKIIEKPKKEEEMNNVDDYIEQKTIRNDKNYNNTYPSDEDVMPPALPNKKYYENFNIEYNSNQKSIGNQEFYTNLDSKTNNDYKQILFFSHVNLNHLITRKKKRTNVVSNCISFRYREKSSTIIYYK